MLSYSRFTRFTLHGKTVKLYKHNKIKILHSHVILSYIQRVIHLGMHIVCYTYLCFIYILPLSHSVTVDTFILIIIKWASFYWMYNDAEHRVVQGRMFRITKIDCAQCTAHGVSSIRCILSSSRNSSWQIVYNIIIIPFDIFHWKDRTIFLFLFILSWKLAVSTTGSLAKP